LLFQIEDTRRILGEAVARLHGYIIDNDYAGYDPYDALSSPLFRLPFLRSNRLARTAAQQTLKRLPFNIRGLLRIPKGRSPVTYGLCIQAYSLLREVFPDKRDAYDQESTKCLERLFALQSKNFSGSCWGYDFDWEARYARFPAYTPTVVATGIITNALFSFYKATGNRTARSLCESACEFVLKDLQRTYDGSTYCLSYSPGDAQQVLNASAKGARLLAQVYSVTGEPSLIGEAKAIVTFIVKRQRPEGAWPYSLGDARLWVDNFHTGYILDCLDEYVECSADRSLTPAIELGLRYYIKHFVTDNGVPKYYDVSLYPVDSTAAAQAILTLTRFGRTQEAVAVAVWMLKNMFSREGYFYYQNWRHTRIRIPYMRWSNAWMFVALSYLLRKMNDLV
jgi:hypothetical protein